MSHYGLNGRFLLNKIPVWNFGNSTCPMERYCDSGCTDPTQTTARLVIVLVRSIQKCGTEEIWGEQFGQMERDISFRPTKMTRPVKVDHAPSNSGRTKPKWSIPLDVPTEISGILGWMESSPLNPVTELLEMRFKFPFTRLGYWRWLFELFNHGPFLMLVNTLRPRTLFRHCFADGLDQKFISVCGTSCRVVRCQVLRIQWNFKFLERKKVPVISKSVVF